MKKLTTCIIGILSIIALFLFLHSPEEKEKTKLARKTKAAFATLDARIVKCTVAEFMLEPDDPDAPIAPLFENLGDHSYKVSTQSERAQAFFNQGLRLTYAFNHAEAHRAFMEAARLDPELAMAYWGQAYALGPNINDAYPDAERKQKAYQASLKALELSANATAVEKDLIVALSGRYSDGPEDELAALNQAYMEAMAKVAKKYKKDPDIQTLYAASIMNTMPWNYWDKKVNPNPNIPEAKAALESAFSMDPSHPGAHHYYIHMVELPNPELAVPSAEALGELMPAAGHLVHMPSHIFIRVGRYKEAAEANVAAVAADEDYVSQCYAQGMYPLAYYPHNIHFLWSSASLLGDSETAIAAAKKTAEKVPVGKLETLTFLQDYFSTPMLAYIRFGKWNEALTIPHPSAGKHVIMIWHYTRGIAFARKGNLKEAREEVEALAEMLKDEELKSLIANYTNNTHNITKVAHRVLAGEVEATAGNYGEAIRLLKEGVKFEDQLTYSEPAAWHIPVRQTLGAVLLKAGKPAEAEKVYREDLEKIRDNGWSLKGLRISLQAQRKTEEAEAVSKRFKKAWADADIEIDGSVL